MHKTWGFCQLITSFCSQLLSIFLLSTYISLLLSVILRLVFVISYSLFLLLHWFHISHVNCMWCMTMMNNTIIQHNQMLMLQIQHVQKRTEITTYEENSCFQKLCQSTVVPGIIPAFRYKKSIWWNLTKATQQSWANQLTTKLFQSCKKFHKEMVKLIFNNNWYLSSLNHPLITSEHSEINITP